MSAFPRPMIARRSTPVISDMAMTPEQRALADSTDMKLVDVLTSLDGMMSNRGLRFEGPLREIVLAHVRWAYATGVSDGGDQMTGATHV